MNETIRYYDNNAEMYYQSTIGANVNEVMKRFLAYLPEGGTILDTGCGSGRDVRAFCDMGYTATGIDASSELVNLARQRLGINATLGDMSRWIADVPVDGIWCCASLMHLRDEGIKSFLINTKYNLKPGGTLFISVKTGVKTGIDYAGRYIRNFTEEELRTLIYDIKHLDIIECWYNEDALMRDDFRWLNIIAERQD